MHAFFLVGVVKRVGPVQVVAHLAMPVYSSGQTVWQIDPARTLLGNDDFIYCAGGGILSHPSGTAAGVIALRQAAYYLRIGTGA
jgi:ribulose-bisphosphate carboxylase large chain